MRKVVTGKQLSITERRDGDPALENNMKLF